MSEHGPTIATDGLDVLIAEVLDRVGGDVRAAAERILAVVTDDARCLEALERLADLTVAAS